MTDQITQNDQVGIFRRSFAAGQAAALAANAERTSFGDALIALIEFIGEDALHASSSIPGGHGCHGPNLTQRDRLIDEVCAAAKATFGAPAVVEPAGLVVDNGLTTVRGMHARVVIGGAA